MGDIVEFHEREQDIGAFIAEFTRGILVFHQLGRETVEVGGHHFASGEQGQGGDLGAAVSVDGPAGKQDAPAFGNIRGEPVRQLAVGFRPGMERCQSFPVPGLGALIGAGQQDRDGPRSGRAPYHAPCAAAGGRGEHLVDQPIQPQRRGNDGDQRRGNNQAFGLEDFFHFLAPSGHQQQHRGQRGEKPPDGTRQAGKAADEPQHENQGIRSAQIVTENAPAVADVFPESLAGGHGHETADGIVAHRHHGKRQQQETQHGGDPQRPFPFAGNQPVRMSRQQQQERDGDHQRSGPGQEREPDQQEQEQRGVAGELFQIKEAVAEGGEGQGHGHGKKRGGGPVVQQVHPEALGGRQGQQRGDPPGPRARPDPRQRRPGQQRQHAQEKHREKRRIDLLGRNPAQERQQPETHRPDAAGDQRRHRQARVPVRIVAVRPGEQMLERPEAIDKRRAVHPVDHAEAGGGIQLMHGQAGPEHPGQGQGPRGAQQRFESQRQGEGEDQAAEVSRFQYERSRRAGYLPVGGKKPVVGNGR